MSSYEKYPHLRHDWQLALFSLTRVCARCNRVIEDREMRSMDAADIASLDMEKCPGPPEPTYPDKLDNP